MFSTNSPLRMSALAAEAASLSLSNSAEFLKAHITVTVVSGKELAAKDKNGASDPYVTLSIDGATAKTSRKRKTLEPVWDEEFTFNLNAPSGKLHLAVWDKDRFSSDDFMGQADFYWDPSKSNKFDQWLELEQRKADEFVSGKIRITIVYEVLMAEITLDDFEILTLIGEGSFGKVYQVKKKDTGQIYAMKALKKKMLIDEEEVEHTKAERDILISNNHPFLINMKFSFQNETRLFFVLDYANGGELFFHLKRLKRFTETMIRFYAAEISLLLIHLHSLGIIYRDLKPENLLLENSGHIKLTDFGLSKMSTKRGRLVRANTFCGTPEYLAPEVLDKKEYGTEVDWWCLGNLLFEMLTGMPPFFEKDTNKMYNKIKTQDVKYPSYASAELKDLINKLLDKDPDTRINDDNVQRQPFFKDVNWTKILQKRVTPPYIPKVSGDTDVSNVDKEYLERGTNIDDDEKDVLTASMNQSFEGFGFVRDAELRGVEK